MPTNLVTWNARPAHPIKAFFRTLAAYAALGTLLALRAIGAGPRVALGVNNPTIKGDSTVIWGIPSGNVSGITGVGIITGAEKGTSSDKLEIQDENGAVVAVVYFNEKNECSVDFIVKTSMPTLAIGDAVTIGGKANCFVEDIREQWRNADVYKVTVKATRYKAIAT